MPRHLCTAALLLSVSFFSCDSAKSQAYAETQQRADAGAGREDAAEARRERRQKRRDRALKTISKFDDDNNRALDVLELAGVVRAMIDELAALHNGVLNVDTTRRARPVIPRVIAAMLISEFDRTGDEELNGFELDRALSKLDEVVGSDAEEPDLEGVFARASSSGAEEDDESNGDTTEDRQESEDDEASEEVEPTEGNGNPTREPERPHCPIEAETEPSQPPTPLPRPF